MNHSRPRIRWRSRTTEIRFATGTSGFGGSRLTISQRAGDQARSAIEAQVLKSPADEDDQPVAELHQVHQVHEQPQEPGDEAVKAQAAEIGDSRRTPYDRQAAFVVITERRGRLAAKTLNDRTRGVTAFLHRDRSDARQGLAVLIEMREVADDEDFGMAGDGEIGPDVDVA